LTTIGYPPIAWTSGTYEWEFGSKEIVVTWLDTYPTSNGTETRIQSVAYSGVFAYKPGKLNSTSITSATTCIVGFAETVPTRSSGVTTSNINTTLLDSRLADSWLNLTRGIKSSEFYYSMKEDTYSTGGPSDQAALKLYGKGKFFYDGWWNNPFASNLI
jgi:hypothetical protein